MKDTSKIPQGGYCYEFLETPNKDNGFKFKTRHCPYWSSRDDKPEQMNGYCSFLERGDWEVEIPDNFPEGFPTSCLSLLWDGVKECGINDDDSDVEFDEE